MINNLKKIREEKGLSMDELAQFCGLSRSSVWHLQQDDKGPYLKTAYVIAKVLGVSVFDIWPDEIEVIEEVITIRKIKQN